MEAIRSAAPSSDPIRVAAPVVVRHLVGNGRARGCRFVTPVVDVVLGEYGNVSAKIRPCAGAGDGVFVEQTDVVGRQRRAHEPLGGAHRVFQQVYRPRRAGSGTDDRKDHLARERQA